MHLYLLFAMWLWLLGLLGFLSKLESKAREDGMLGHAVAMGSFYSMQVDIMRCAFCFTSSFRPAGQLVTGSMCQRLSIGILLTPVRADDCRPWRTKKVSGFFMMETESQNRSHSRVVIS